MLGKQLALGLIATSFAIAPALASDGALKTRDKMDPAYQWRIEDIFTTEKAWNQAWTETQKAGKALAGYQGKLSSPKELYEFITHYEGICGKLDRLYGYAARANDQDTAVSKYDAMLGKAETLLKDIGTATAFAVPEIAKFTDEQLHDIIKAEPRLKPYSHYLHNILRQAEHTLPHEQEALLAQASELMGTPENAFGKLADADLTFPTIKGEKGEPIELSEGRYGTLLDSEDRNVRKNAYVGLLSTYQKVNNTMAALLNGEVKVHVFNRTVRKYPSAIASALDNENIPISVYDNLIASVNKGLPTLHRYYALRKKILGVKELYPYDWNVALVPESKMTFTYQQSVDIMDKAMAPLGQDYLKLLKLGFDNRWVDVYENKGKRSGAYSASVFGVHPFVLHNYTDNYWGLSTLAHEMGHAINGYLSQTNNSYFNSDNPIFVAEVASQTNELLLMDYMLKSTTDNKQKLYLLCQYADGIIGSLYRQTQYAEFEKAIHERGDAGETLTAEWLNRTWKDILKKYAGPDNVLLPESQYGWSRIPHFYYNFYVYKYSTSYAASLAIAERIQKEGNKAAKPYFDFLKAGSAQYPVELLKKAGVDLTTPAPVETTIRKFDSIIDEIDRVSKEIK